MTFDPQLHFIDIQKNAVRPKTVNMKAKSSFTRNIEAAHDQAPREVSGGGVYTAVEAEKGKKRIS